MTEDFMWTIYFAGVGVFIVGGVITLIYYIIKGDKVHDECPWLFGRRPVRDYTTPIPSTSYTDPMGRTRCTLHTKVIHATQQSAESQVANFARTHGEYRRAYIDPACGNWHVSSQHERHRQW